MHFFMYLFIHFISLNVSDCLVCRSGILRSHLHRLIMPDDVLIQFDFLNMALDDRNM